MSNLRQTIEERLRIRGSYRRLFESPDGKEVLRHLCKVGFVTKTTFVAGDPHHTALNEGSRRLVLSILRFVNKDDADLVREIESVAHDT